MSQAQRDQNHIPIAMGVSSADGVTPLPFLVDPVTGRLLITIYPVTTEALVTGEYTNKAKRDANHVPMIMGVTDDVDETVTSLITASIPTAQNLFCDVLIEP